MNGDRLGPLMWEVRVPDSGAARERAVAAARAAVPAGTRIAGRSAATRSPRRTRLAPIRRRAWAFGLALAAVLTAVTLLTPAGRSALADVADLIGRIGGSPASDGDEGIESTVPPGRPGSPTVVDNGTAPDGSRYEWVAYRRKEGLGSGAGPGVEKSVLDTFCLRFAWADAPRRVGTGGCTTLGGWSPGVVHLSGRLVRPARSGGPRDYMLIGGVDPRVGRLEIVYRRPAGRRVELPVDLARVDGDLLRRAGGERPFTVFSAFVPSRLVSADRLADRYRLMSLSVVDPTSPMPLPYTAAYKRCIGRHGGFYARGWVDVVVYDRRDRQVATLRTRTARPKPTACDGVPSFPRGGVMAAPRIRDTPARMRLLRAFPPRHP